MVKRLQTSWNWPWVSPTTVTLVASSCKSNCVGRKRIGHGWGELLRFVKMGWYWGFKVGIFRCWCCTTMM
jgi:hypothetical protein